MIGPLLKFFTPDDFIYNNNNKDIIAPQFLGYFLSTVLRILGLLQQNNSLKMMEGVGQKLMVTLDYLL